MALPFDIRVYAATADTPDPENGGSLPGAHGAPGRPSHALIIPPEVVAGVRVQEAEAFRELVRIAYVPLARFARTIVGSRDEAEDVVQNVFALVWDRADLWHPSMDSAAYLFRSVRNHALNEVRRRGREMRRAQQVEGTGAWKHEGPDVSANPLERLIAAETQTSQARILAGVLASCTEHQRTAYDLRYCRGMSAAGIGEVLGISPKSAAKLVGRVTHLVLDRLREEIQRGK